jgi:potassium efflux system protein
MRQLFFGLLLCFIAALALADPAQPEPPNPANLSSDWWAYFEPAEKLSADDFVKRVKETKLQLNALLEKLPAKDNSAYAPLVTRINSQLDSFAKLKSAKSTVEKPVPSALDSYSLKDALTRFGEWRQLNKDYQVSKEDIDWRTAVIAEERKQQSRRRNQYLEMGKTDPQRFSKGLELMVSRIKLELQKVNLDRQLQLLNSLETERDGLKAELELIPQRLTGSSEERKQWQKEFASAQEKLRKLSEQPEQARAEVLDLDQDDTETQIIQARYFVLVGVQRQVEATEFRLRTIQAQMAQQLIEILLAQRKVDTGQIRRLLSDYGNIQTETDTNLNTWKKASERLKTYASGLTVDKAAQDPKTVKLKKKATSLAANVDQSLVSLAQQQAYTGYIADLLEQKMQASEGWVKRGVKDTTHVAWRTWQVTLNLLTATLFEINEVPVTMLGLFRILLILLIAWWLSKGIRNGLHRVGERRTAVSKSSLYTLGRIVHYFIMVIGVIIGLSSIGIDFTKFALFASALGVGIGFGLQTLISNFVAGLIILFEKSLKVGDFVELASGVTGEVREINMRSTLITTNDNIDILVPNSEFVGGRVINWTLREAYRRIHVPFGVAYGTDKDLVKKAVLEAADEVQWTLKGKKGRTPQVWFVQFGDSSLNFELVVWLTPEAVKRPSAVQAAYLWEIETKLNKYGIEIPFPQRDLHLRSAFGKKDEEGLSLLTHGTVDKP